MLQRTDLPQGYRNQFQSLLSSGWGQEFPNDRVVNSYLSRRAGPRVTRRIPKVVAK